ncbi:MAG: ABC transporter ATP-binding protein, partial [Lachnospiraceae bacterium]|nr:ABC transporter ATP-binding protein [Lachnospiraceae bacterium]
MKKLLVYLKNYKKESLLGPFFKLVEVVFELMVPIVMASLIDKGIGMHDREYILKMFATLILFGVCGLAASISAQYFAAKAATGFAKEVKHALFEHIQTLSFAEMDKLGVSSLITRMTSDMNQVQTGVNMTLRLLLRSPFVVFGAMIMAFTIDVQAALIFVVTIPILSIVIFGIMLFCIPKYRKVQEKLDRVLSTTRENLEGTRVIRAFCKEEEEIKIFGLYNEDLTNIQKKVGCISALMNPVTYIIINIAIAILIWNGAIRVAAGVLTQGAVVALYNYMSQILVELIKLANLIISITKTIACGNRIQSVFETSSDMEEGRETAGKSKNESMVEFRNVSMQYQGSGEATLENISFAAKPGQVIGIIGGTGSG